MYENDIETIKRAQEGNKTELEKLVQDNNRVNMENSKKV